MFRHSVLIVVSASALLLQTPGEGQTTSNNERSSGTVSRVAPQAPDIDKQVGRLVKRMLNRRTEQAAFSDLEALGCSAVPAIVARMDDRRRLPDPRIALTNKSPDAFEGRRFYGPQQVVDALAAILNQMTGQDFGFIYNGAGDDERARAVQSWRDYLRRTPAPRLCDGG
jgi:hypothetical protein